MRKVNNLNRVIYGRGKERALFSTPLQLNVLKRILDLKQKQKAVKEKLLNTIHNPKFHFLDLEFQNIETGNYFAFSAKFLAENAKTVKHNMFEM